VDIDDDRVAVAAAGVAIHVARRAAGDVPAVLLIHRVVLGPVEAMKGLS
jgi:hypothetical protein